MSVDGGAKSEKYSSLYKVKTDEPYKSTFMG
jgi:hypothetical protein